MIPEMVDRQKRRHSNQRGRSLVRIELGVGISPDDPMRISHGNVLYGGENAAQGLLANKPHNNEWSPSTLRSPTTESTIGPGPELAGHHGKAVETILHEGRLRVEDAKQCIRRAKMFVAEQASVLEMRAYLDHQRETLKSREQALQRKQEAFFSSLAVDRVEELDILAIHSDRAYLSRARELSSAQMDKVQSLERDLTIKEDRQLRRTNRLTHALHKLFPELTVMEDVSNSRAGLATGIDFSNLSQSSHQSVASNIPSLVGLYLQQEAEVDLERDRILELAGEYDEEVQQIKVPDHPLPRVQSVPQYKIVQAKVRLEELRAQAEDLRGQCKRAGLNPELYRRRSPEAYEEEPSTVGAYSEYTSSQHRTDRIYLEPPRYGLYAHAPEDQPLEDVSAWLEDISRQRYQRETSLLTERRSASMPPHRFW